MAVKTITITEDAYNHLAAKKAAGESFSDVVLRLSGGHSILELAGTLGKKDAEHVESAIKKSRKRWRERSKRISQEFR
jgi:predicted CopG family antitoxin